MARETKKYRKSTKLMYIFCEGKTEQNYFNKLKVFEHTSKLKINAKNPSETSALDLVKKAIKAKKKERYGKKDIVVVIFDADKNNDQQLDETVRLAKQNNILPIFSNPCFEYWILCHYKYFTATLNRKEIKQLIIKKYYPTYKKSSLRIHEKTRDKIKTAIKNAKKIKEKHLREGQELFRQGTNPLTLIFELIEKINEFK